VAGKKGPKEKDGESRNCDCSPFLFSARIAGA